MTNPTSTGMHLWLEPVPQSAGRNEAVIVAPTGAEIGGEVVVPEAAAEVGDAAVRDAEAVAATAAAVIAAGDTKRFCSRSRYRSRKAAIRIAAFSCYVPNARSERN